jgi:hypothetical protein
LVLLVNDSEYSRLAGAKPILSLSCIYLVSPGARRAPTPPRPPFFGEGKYHKKNQKKKIMGDGRGRGGGEMYFEANLKAGLYPLGLKPRDTTPMDMEVQLPGLGES